MINNLLFDTNLTDYGILIGSGIILGCSIYYLIRRNQTLFNKIEALTNEEIEGIVNENAVTVINNENIDAIIDSDTDTDIESIFLNTSDDESIIDLTELDLFFMPDVDFDVCSIQVLKFFEICSMFSREMAAKGITEEQITELIYSFTDIELLTNSINDLNLLIINNF